MVRHILLGILSIRVIIAWLGTLLGILRVSAQPPCPSASSRALHHPQRALYHPQRDTVTQCAGDTVTRCGWYTLSRALHHPQRDTVTQCAGDTVTRCGWYTLSRALHHPQRDTLIQCAGDAVTRSHALRVRGRHSHALRVVHSITRTVSPAALTTTEMPRHAPFHCHDGAMRGCVTACLTPQFARDHTPRSACDHTPRSARATHHVTTH
jgi:hypothetical protein